MEKEKLALEIYNVAAEIKKEICPGNFVISDNDFNNKERAQNIMELLMYQDIAERTICGYLRKNKKDSLVLINEALSENKPAFYLLNRIDSTYEAIDEVNNIDTLHSLLDGLISKKNFQELLGRINEMVMEDADYLKADKLYNKIKKLENHIKDYCETLEVMDSNSLNKNQIGVYIKYSDIPEQLEMKKKTVDNVLKQYFNDKEYNIKYYIDKIITGEDEDRKEFKDMICDIKNNNLDFVVCPALNNISRDSIYLNTVFFPMLDEKNIELYTNLGKFEESDKLEFKLKTSHAIFFPDDNDYEEDDYEDDDYEY